MILVSRKIVAFSMNTELELAYLRMTPREGELLREVIVDLAEIRGLMIQMELKDSSGGANEEK